MGKLKTSQLSSRGKMGLQAALTDVVEMFSLNQTIQEMSYTNAIHAKFGLNAVKD